MVPPTNQVVCSLTHLVPGVVSAAWGYSFLRHWRHHSNLYYGFLVYFTSTVFLFFASGLYHGVLYLTAPYSEPSEVFHSLDHIGIALFFAATITAIHGLYFRGWWRWHYVKWVWALILPAAAIKAALINYLTGWSSLIFFIVVFSPGIVTTVKLIQAHGFKKAWPLYFGGILIVVSAFIERLHLAPVYIPGLIGYHECFHIFVTIAIFVQMLHLAKAVREKRQNLKTRRSAARRFQKRFARLENPHSP